ncbi:MAG: hypothetical protein LBQ98_02005 [Nitrososphaerota archaeon]|jgi:hypothetical protein|nr:hypothetical protein [Nitrososphaerota archaeon]
MYPNLYNLSIDTTVHGVKSRTLLFYDALNHVKLCRDLPTHIEALKVELTGLKRIRKRTESL